MSIEKAKEFVRDNHGSTLKDDRMSDSPWISVEDEPVPEGVYVDVWVDGVREADVLVSGGDVIDPYMWGKKPTHWMPIPNSPK